MMITVTLVLDNVTQEQAADFLSGMMSEAQYKGYTVETAALHKELSLIEKMKTVIAYLHEISEEVTEMEKEVGNGEDQGRTSDP